MMHVVSIPPFERFYEEHRSEVMRFLRRQLGRERADDAFQETFLRALQAYGRLAHGDHLRAWVLIIARNVAIDAVRRASPTARVPEDGREDGMPAYQDLAPFTDGLPPTERAAVVLRFGYDLSYDQIASALGSNAAAARQATSTGVRKIRKRRFTE
jgi:RNA polymerase sigma factor (sigma-70 family)